MRSRLAILAVLFAACSKGDSGAPQSDGVVSVLTNLGVSAPANTIAVGGTMQLSAAPVDQKGDTYPVTVTWGSASNFVATVTPTGFVKGVAGGQTYLFAFGGNLYDSTLVTVITSGYPTNAQVYMLPEAYSPLQTDVAKGATVLFAFPSIAHNVFFNASPPGAPADIPGEVSNQIVARVFATVGSFTYNCTIHPGMTATIIVH
jgi:plastocyanin